MIRKAALLTLLTALLAIPAGMAGTAVAAPPPGRVAAAAPADPLFVSEITPEVVRVATAPVTVAGTVTGTAGSFVRVAVRYSRDRPFTSRAEMAAYLSEQGYATTNWSTRVQATLLDQSGKLPFRFTVTPAELGMPRPGVYPFEIEVTDAATGQRLGIERTFLTYAPKGEQIPKVKLAVALPIVDRPHRADDATFMDDDLSASLTSGRLASLLQTAQDTGDGVTWFVDPALLDDVRVLSSGPRSVRGTRKNADPAAGQWLNGLRSALTDKTVVATPYADPDMAALVHHGLDKQAAASIQRGAALATELLGREIHGTTAWPAGGKIDRDAVDELAMSGVTSVLLSGDALPPRAANQDATPERTGRSPARADHSRRGGQARHHRGQPAHRAAGRPNPQRGPRRERVRPRRRDARAAAVPRRDRDDRLRAADPAERSVRTDGPERADRSDRAGHDGEDGLAHGDRGPPVTPVDPRPGVRLQPPAGRRRRPLAAHDLARLGQARQGRSAARRPDVLRAATARPN